VVVSRGTVAPEARPSQRSPSRTRGEADNRHDDPSAHSTNVRGRFRFGSPPVTATMF
jgi:hypothetical protein